MTDCHNLGLYSEDRANSLSVGVREESRITRIWCNWEDGVAIFGGGLWEGEQVLNQGVCGPSAQIFLKSMCKHVFS